MLRDRVRHLVPLEDVLEGPDRKTELFGQPDEHQNLILAVAVDVDDALALEDLERGIQAQVAPLAPRTLVVACRHEGVAHDLLHAHPRLRVASGFIITPIRLLDVLSEGELDTWLCPGECEALGIAAPPAQFDDLVLPPHRVRRAV